MSYNKFIGMGRLTRDPEIVLAGASKVCKSGLAIDSGFGKHKKTCFIEFEAWGEKGEFIKEHFGKGDGVHIEGQLEFDTWTNKKTLEKQSKHKIRVENVDFPIGPKSDWKKIVDKTFPDAEEVPNNSANEDL